jgi:hypothetical protein
VVIEVLTDPVPKRRRVMPTWLGKEELEARPIRRNNIDLQVLLNGRKLSQISFLRTMSRAALRCPEANPVSITTKVVFLMLGGAIEESAMWTKPTGFARFLRTGRQSQ